jgi:DNA-binding MarR family transcriptional regulator
MIDVVVVSVAVLVASAIGAMVVYWRLLRKARREYENARESVEDIVLSFNRQLKHEAGKMEIVAYKVEALASKSDRALKKAEETEKAMQTVEGAFAVVRSDGEKVLAKVDEFDRKVCDVVASKAMLSERVTSLEERAKQLPVLSESSVEAAIPIRRDKALAPLTETEVGVLEMLSAEGPKTAPEIKERIRLSREHTARLMKKLYEGGYLERETNKIPFRYSVKKEMEKFLKKAESEAQ